MATRIRAGTRRQMQDKARCIALALGVRDYAARFHGAGLWCKGRSAPFSVQWTVDDHDLRLTCLMLQRARHSCEVYWNGTYNLWCSDPEFIPPLFRALLRLEFTQWSIFEDHLGALSAHERSELMLAVPHELWPPRWKSPDTSPPGI